MDTNDSRDPAMRSAGRVSSEMAERLLQKSFTMAANKAAMTALDEELDRPQTKNKVSAVMESREAAVNGKSVMDSGTSRTENDFCEAAILQRCPELASSAMRNVKFLWTPDGKAEPTEIDMVFPSIRLGIEVEEKHRDEMSHKMAGAWGWRLP